MYAVQLSAEDVSNKIITCSGPLLAGKPPGSCLMEPPNTLIVTARLEHGEDASVLKKMYVVANNNGTYHQYVNDPTIATTSRWHQLTPSVKAVAPTTATFEIAPFETTAVSRQVKTDKFSGMKGVQIYIGVRGNDDTPFAPNNLKKVFEVQ